MTPARSASRMFLVLFALAAGLRVGLWLIGGQVLQPSSDESITMLQAAEVARGHFPLLFMAQPYLFPLEAYLAAPLAWLPPGGLACRLLSLLLGLATTALALLWLPRHGSKLTRWLGGLLAVAPSFYVLMLQGFYALPGYSILMFACLALPAMALSARSKRHGLPAFAVGVLSGLGFAAHSLTLCASVPALFALLTFPDQVGHTMRRLAYAGAGLALGLVPYELARWILPGAHELATATRAWPETLERWWTLGPVHTLPITMGFRPATNPMIDAGSYLLPINDTICSIMLGILLATALVWRLVVHAQTLAHRKLPVWQAPDLLLAAILINMTLFAASPRANEGSCRYFLPTALGLPLLLAFMMAQGIRPLQRLAATFAMIILLIQVPTAWSVIETWLAPGYDLTAHVPNLNYVLALLDELDIHYALAPYGIAYRLTYLSRGRVLASQTKNERFGGWPYPYKSEVEAAPRVALVLTEDTSSRLTPDRFEKQLAQIPATATVRTAGDFRVYADFKELHPHPIRRLRPAELTVTASRPEVAYRLTDGRRLEPYRLRRIQSTNDYFTLMITRECALDHLRIHYGLPRDRPATTRIYLHLQGAWNGPILECESTLLPFELVDQKPRYDRFQERLDLGGRTGDGIRVDISQPRENKDLNILEVEVYERLPAEPTDRVNADPP